ncbi:RelE/StbE family addiction module toxin [Enterococcus aquimarinus]|uniref:RelE/StbE family addiction module toxin n=1 Tax=Enterococcus aquimarinus TaxID=328396 RepID=A0A1L8QN70_9ENTE|nr:RelE/StbE family addiction module toxin [Enterococcus aquimarinus]
MEKMDKHQAMLILSWITKNLEGIDSPRIHGKGLVGIKSGQWRYRIGDYRLIANIDDETITILVLEIGLFVK